jgi:glycosyltransferase involved in cell wall biosynthesis
LKRARAVIAVSHWQADEIVKLVSIQPVVIPNIIRVDNFKNVKTQSPSNPVQFGFLGTMNTPVKGLDLILKAISSIRQDFIFHIGGDGVLAENYKSLAKEVGVFEKCVFYGLILPEQVPAFMSRLHFFVNASRSETFGIAIVEAMACGLPVIASDCGGPFDFIKPFNGKLTPKEDVNELGIAIDFMMNHFRDYHSEEIREFAFANYSSKKFISEIEKIYASTK